MEYIKKEKLLENKDSILIGVSGGVDSVALLHFLVSIRDRYELTLFAAHINHGLRGSDSENDEKFVVNLCNFFDIKLYLKKIDIRQKSIDDKISIEEAGRNARYDYFDMVCKKYNIKKVALAHHRDDQVETILMRIIRGTGFKGLRGILPFRDNIIRPFLSIGKDEIEIYANENNLYHRQDNSNYELIYHRNNIRLELIPMMEKLNNNFKENILHIGKMSRDYYDFFQKEIENNWNFIVVDNKIDIKSFNKLHIALKREILLKWCNCVHNIGFSHIEIILNKLMESSITTWSIDLPGGYKIKRKYEYLFLEKNTNIAIQNYSYLIRENKVYCLPKINIIVSNEILSPDKVKKIHKNRFVAFFDYDKIKILGVPMILRNKSNGDRIAPVGMLGTKKIKDIFIDRKIPVDERWKIPVLAVNEEIVWVLGYNKGRNFMIDSTTKKILMISFKYIKEEDSSCIRI